MRIDCPFCGPRDHGEFRYGGDGGVTYPPLEAPAEDWLAAVYQRDNPRGRQTETWQHVYGCRQWLLVERDTLSHVVYSVRLAHAGSAADGGAS